MNTFTNNNTFLSFESEPLQAKKRSNSSGHKISIVAGLTLMCIGAFLLGRQTASPLKAHDKVAAELAVNSDKDFADLVKKAADAGKANAPAVSILVSPDKKIKEDVLARFKNAAKAATCEFGIVTSDATKIQATLRAFKFTYDGPAIYLIAKQKIFKKLTEGDVSALDEAGLKKLFDDFCAAA